MNTRSINRDKLTRGIAVIFFAVTLAFLVEIYPEQANEQENLHQAGDTQQQAPLPATQATTYSAVDFYQTTSYRLASAPAWSADGSSLLIGSDQTGTHNVYRLSVKDGQREALTVSEEDSNYPVSWFPHDERVLFSADKGGNELTHLYVREADGNSRDLTPGDNLKAIFSGWSGDKAHFYVLSNERQAKSFDLYRYSAADYARELVYQNDDAWSIDAISRDDRYLVFRRENASGDSDLYLFDTTDKQAEPRHITPHQGKVQHVAFAFTPDNQRFVYGTDADSEFMQAWTYDLSTGAHSPLVQAEWDVVFLFFSDSGKYRVTGINEDARMVIRIESTASGDSVPLPQLPPGQLAQVRFSPDERQIALMLSSDTSPRDAWVIDLEQKQLSRLTQALSPEIDEAMLVTSKVVRYPGIDGLAIPAILYKPPAASAANPQPALVWVHGGPGGQSTTGYRAIIQHLVNHGYAVLMANNRGSSGYGKTFFHMDDKKHGEVDLDDIVYAGRYLAEQDWVDSERIGIIGGSYGGYMVGAALAFRPGEFKVGINIFGVMNWVRTLESIPPYWEAIRVRLYDELGDPATDGERLRRISPLFHAENIKTPLLVIQGANDPRVLKVESDEIVAAVKANGVPVEYLVFDDEGHGFSQKANRIAASEAFVRFLQQHL